MLISFEQLVSYGFNIFHDKALSFQFTDTKISLHPTLEHLIV